MLKGPLLILFFNVLIYVIISSSEVKSNLNEFSIGFVRNSPYVLCVDIIPFPICFIQFFRIAFKKVSVINYFTQSRAILLREFFQDLKRLCSSSFCSIFSSNTFSANSVLFFKGFQYPFSNPWFFHCFLISVRNFFYWSMFFQEKSTEKSTSFLLILRTNFQFVLHNSDLNWASLTFLKS